MLAIVPKTSSTKPAGDPLLRGKTNSKNHFYIHNITFLASVYQYDWTTAKSLKLTSGQDGLK
jgi:hypothetical protein